MSLPKVFATVQNHLLNEKYESTHKDIHSFMESVYATVNGAQGVYKRKIECDQPIIEGDKLTWSFRFEDNKELYLSIEARRVYDQNTTKH